MRGCLRPLRNPAREGSIQSTIMHKLYFAPTSCSMAPHILLREAGLPFELVRVILRTHTTKDGTDFYAIHPLGQVPVLALEGGEVLSEAAVILQYVADHAPEAKFLPPPGTMDRYRALEWLNFIASDLHKGIGMLFNRKLSDEAKAVIRDLAATRLAYAEKKLGARPFTMGETFSAPDAYLFTILNWTGFVGIDLGSYPALAAFVERMRARDSVRAAFEAEQNA
jgi:glutathione S-transferase